MGATPEIGRLFTAQEYLPGPAGRIATIAYGFWMRRFGGDNKVFNRTIELSGRPRRTWRQETRSRSQRDCG